MEYGLRNATLTTFSLFSVLGSFTSYIPISTHFTYLPVSSSFFPGGDMQDVESMPIGRILLLTFSYHFIFNNVAVQRACPGVHSCASTEHQYLLIQAERADVASFQSQVFLLLCVDI